MDKIILKLLKENGRIIIPDFGAFIVKQKSPFKVIFNEFLQYNDGALINALSDKEKISQNEAAEKIKQLTNEFSSKLNAGEQIELPEIGILTKSQTGKITLSDSGDDIPKTQKTEETKTEETKEKRTIEFDLTDKKTQEKPKKVEPKKTSPPKQEPKKVADKPVKEKEEPVIIQKEEKKVQPAPKDEPVSRVQPTPPVAEYYTDEPSRNWTSIILWIIVIVIVNGAIFGFFFYGDEIKTFFGKDKQEEPTTNVKIPENNEIISDETDLATSDTGQETVIEESVEEETLTQTETPIFTGTKYYVVAGVFREESNANNLVIKLRNQGYNSEKFGKIGLMHAVCYDVFQTKQEADRYMMKIKREVDKDAWIRIVD